MPPPILRLNPRPTPGAKADKKAATLTKAAKLLSEADAAQALSLLERAVTHGTASPSR